MREPITFKIRTCSFSVSTIEVERANREIHTYRKQNLDLTYKQFLMQIENVKLKFFPHRRKTIEHVNMESTKRSRNGK